MNTLKNTVIMLSVSLIVMGFFIKFLPKGKFCENVKNIFALLMTVIVISLFFGGANIDLTSFDTDFSTDFSAENYTTIAEQTLRLFSKRIETDLSENGFNVQGLTINYTETDDGVKIEGIVVKTDNFSEVSAFIKENYGIDAKAG